MKIRYLLPFTFIFFIVRADPLAEIGRPIRPLAQNHVVVDSSPDADTVPMFTPSILALPGGRLIAACERGGEWAKKHEWSRIFISDDGGKTWILKGTGSMWHGRLFRSGASIYYLGHNGDLQIMRSDDNGETWSKQVSLTSGQRWHGSADNVWYAKGNVYLVMERRTDPSVKVWDVGVLAPVLMRAKEGDDLTKPESWTFASELVFADVIPGYRDNKPLLLGVGVPFYKQNFPGKYEMVHRRAMEPMGWLEGNVVQIMDPDHYWYDPAGNTFHLFMRAHTGGTGYAALAKVHENPDGTMTTSLVQAPSGAVMLLLPFPGGQMRFHVLYDKQTKLYWLLGTQSTNSMTRVEKMPPERYNLPNNERQRLVLHFSRNMVDWCFAGVVAIEPNPRGSRHYASMDIDGDDLVILSRSGDANAESAHNGNLITFHRIKNFRNLVY